jgi:hypothetical protein
MHGLKGGGWKRNVDHGRTRKRPGGNSLPKRRDLPSINVTAPAAYPTEPSIPANPHMGSEAMHLGNRASPRQRIDGVLARCKL